MKPADVMLTETLRNISKYCSNRRDCFDCMFFDYGISFNGQNCRIKQLSRELTASPEQWDMEKLERIINESSNTD